MWLRMNSDSREVLAVTFGKRDTYWKQRERTVRGRTECRSRYKQKRFKLRIIRTIKAPYLPAYTIPRIQALVLGYSLSPLHPPFSATISNKCDIRLFPHSLTRHRDSDSCQ
jgi:hypothetical protein